MKVALLGDIHGNAMALRAVLSAASLSGAESLLITGDLVGYYFAPLEVLALLQPWSRRIVKGNHEEMLSRARTDTRFLYQAEALYGSGLRVAGEQVSGKQLDELDALPHPLELMLNGCRILLCHGAPWDNGCYLYPDAQPDLLSRCAERNFDLVVVGHTHYPMQLTVGETRIVNPGSVGQPRNRQPGAHWVLFDTATGKLEFHCERYNVSELVHECRRRHPELPYLAEVLIRQ